jgi:hypothetical protein
MCSIYSRIRWLDDLDILLHLDELLDPLVHVRGFRKPADQEDVLQATM